MHHVVGTLAEGFEDSRVGGHERRRIVRRGRARAVEEVVQSGRVDPHIDNANPVDLRTGCGEDIDLMATGGQAGGEVGKKRLRSTALGLAYRRHKRGDECEPQGRFALKARSRGGLTPRTAYGTRALPRVRTSSAACGKKISATSIASRVSWNSIHMGPGKLTCVYP